MSTRAERRKPICSTSTTTTTNIIPGRDVCTYIAQVPENKISSAISTVYIGTRSGKPFHNNTDLAPKRQHPARQLLFRMPTTHHTSSTLKHADAPHATMSSLTKPEKKKTISKQELRAGKRRAKHKINRTWASKFSFHPPIQSIRLFYSLPSPTRSTLDALQRHHHAYQRFPLPSLSLRGHHPEHNPSAVSPLTNIEVLEAQEGPHLGALEPPPQLPVVVLQRGVEERPQGELRQPSGGELLLDEVRQPYLKARTHARKRQSK